MAHYIAGLIESTERSEPSEQPSKRKECAEAILALWQHRDSLPHNTRPFRDFEGIFRTLTKLDPTPERVDVPFLLDEALDEERQANASDWLRLAVRIDRTGRLLLYLCIKEAMIEAANESLEWASLAHSAGLQSEDVNVILAVARNHAATPAITEEEKIASQFEMMKDLSDAIAIARSKLEQKHEGLKKQAL